MDSMDSKSGEDEIASSVFSMCTSGDVQSLKALYQREPYVKTLIQMTQKNEANTKKIAEKTLFVSTLRGHFEVTQFLLEKGANPNVSTALGTPVYAAVKSGILEMVRLLVSYDANYRIKGGFSPVYIACIEGKLNILKYLVDIGADLYGFDNPPLVFTACSTGKLDILKYLMEEMDYDIHRTMHGEDALRTDGKDTLLYTACQRGKTDVAQYLMQQGAYITQTITNTFPQIIKAILRDKFRPVGKPDPIQLYQARLKELGLAEIPWGVLADYSTCLTRLELRSNYLTSLPDRIFQLPTLKNLDISHNRLPEICQEEVVWECRSLTDFDASHNQITYAPSGLFQMPELTTLQLSYNLLNHLPGDPDDPSAQTSTGLPADIKWLCEKLKRLDLSHNRLHSLPDTFSDLRRLNVLMVSHNSLKELPPSCSWGCINLVHLDANMNQLSDLPIGCANSWMHSLERLHLSRNNFTQISRNITELTHLTVLDLSHNNITSLPPTAWWYVNRLMKLQLNHNRLDVLSHKNDQQRESTAVDDRRPTALRSVFDVIRGRGQKDSVSPEPQSEAGDNQPRELPADLWFSSLQSLYLHNNRLKWLPGYIGKLGALTRLDISGNPDLKTLPLNLGRLHNCWELTLHGLTLTNVPHHLLPGVRGGSAKRLLAYLRAQLRHCEPYNRMKLMAVGLQGRGKTTLISVLRNPSAPLPANVSTVGVEVAEWTLSPPAHILRTIKKNHPLQRHQMDIVFSTWDLAGQEVYYATHQCFLSRNTLYLVVWSMEEGEKGIEYLRPWLLNIQARAPHSPVLIVGTHLDKLSFSRANDLKQKYKDKIKSLYGKSGFPNLSAIMFVAATTQEGIKELQERVHHAAISAIDHDTRDPIIGMQVPASYINLQKLIAEEVRSCHEKGIPPVLSQKEFAALADRMPDSDISDPEELSLAAQFLHDNGVLLHYNDHLRGLNNLYFIDPVWLADLLAEVVTVPQRQNFVHNGILKESNVAFIFHDSRRFPSKYFPQYLQLLERFEIALSLGNNQRLIPSMLPMERPAINFTDPPTQEPPRPSEGSKLKQRSAVRATLTGYKPPQDGLRVMSAPANCIRRRYQMAYTPSGFWSRLISRLIINLRRSGLMEERVTNQSGPPIIYWRRGIVVIHTGGRFIVESIQSTKNAAVMGTQDMEASAKYVGEGVDLNIGLQGVDITVWSFNGDYSAMGYVVDHLDSLIDEWFPGLNDLDVEGEWLVQRQVLWKVSSELLKDRGEDQTSKSRREKWSILPQDSEREEYVTFQLDSCAAEALTGDTIVCREYNVRVPLRNLVPDLLLTDLPSDLKIDQSQLEYNPHDPATHLGRGGAGAVYRGKYRRQIVAVKEFLTAEQAEHTGETEVGKQSLRSEEDVITAGEALFMFRDLRQEVTVLAQLDHPFIVSLLGVSIHPMCMVIELAPMGSLFGILDKRVEQFKAAQEDRASACLRMPGGVLGHEISTRIALQVAMALRYLHGNGVVYRDLKSDNVLVWSLDPNDPVNVKLADYGISRFANPGGVKGEEGTPGYLAPEAIRRRGEDQAFDEKVDIFSYAMLLFELLTGQRPFESLTTTQELNKAVSQGDRPLVAEGNLGPAFPGMENLMYDCWKQSAMERPGADEVVVRVCEPGFLCRKHTITKSKDHPLQKIDTIYARPIFADDLKKSYQVWTWARQDTERNFSIIDARKGVYNLPEKSAPGGRVYAMTATGEIEKRIWIGTADCEIQVYGYRNVGDPQCLWTFYMKDSVLSLSTELEGGRVKRVFASLANGTLCVFSRKSTSTDPASASVPIGDTKLIPEACVIKCDEEQYQQEAEDWSNPLILKLDERSKSAKCMVFVGHNKLWCGCGNTITVVDIVNMKVINHIPVFVRRMALVNELVSNGIKVWGVGRQLSCVMEWDTASYKLLHVFNCSEIDQTGTNVRSDPAKIEDLFDPNRNTQPSSTGTQPQTEGRSEDAKEDSFSVQNDPTPASSHAPFSTTRTRQTLRIVKNRPRRAAMTSHQRSDSPNTAGRSRLLTARNRVLRKQQGSTRTTSLVVVDNTLWVGRGMGDVVVIDITEDGGSHGTVLARLTSEDSEKYGNRSHHKLQYVAGEYVVSSQWLEPIDMRRGSSAPPATLGGGGGGGGGGGEGSVGGLSEQLAETPLITHQAITIWDGWNQDLIKQFKERCDAILALEMQEEEPDAV